MKDFSGAVIAVCINRREDPARPSCHARGSLLLLRSLRQAVPGGGVGIQPSTCLGHCQQGPVAKIIRHDREQIITGASLETLSSMMGDG